MNRDISEALALTFGVAAVIFTVFWIGAHVTTKYWL